MDKRGYWGTYGYYVPENGTVVEFVSDEEYWEMEKE